MPEAISANSVAVYNHLIFVQGDYSDQNLTGFLNTETGVFSSIKSNMADRKHAAAVVLYDHLMVIGGISNVSRTHGLINVQVADLRNILQKESY